MAVMAPTHGTLLDSRSPGALLTQLFHLIKYVLSALCVYDTEFECRTYSDERHGDFPGGAVVKNLPANSGDMGSIPGPGRSHMLWSN